MQHAMIAIDSSWPMARAREALAQPQGGPLQHHTAATHSPCPCAALHAWPVRAATALVQASGTSLTGPASSIQAVHVFLQLSCLQ